MSIKKKLIVSLVCGSLFSCTENVVEPKGPKPSTRMDADPPKEGTGTTTPPKG